MNENGRSKMVAFEVVASDVESLVVFKGASVVVPLIDAVEGLGRMKVWSRSLSLR
jgi:hypothetical protein